MSTPDSHADAIRRHAHRLAAEAIHSGLNMWELNLYYPGQDDQDTLAAELIRIAQRLEKQGGGS